MKRGRFTSLLFPFTLTVLGLYSCINEDMSNCVQYAVMTQLVNKSGDVLPDSMVGTVKAYLFLNNKFDHVVTAESNGKYLISFDNNSSATLVTFGNMNPDSINIHTPETGEDISQISIGLLGSSTRTITGSFASPAHLFYGRFDYTSVDKSSTTTTVTLPMYNQHARVHVVSKHLLAQFGEGNYQIVLQGFRDAITFAGVITGDSVIYSPSGSFSDNDVYTTEAVNTLPTKVNEYVTVQIYKDGALLWATDQDENGKQVTLSAEDDKVIVIDVQKLDFYLQVMSWNDYQQSTVIY